MELFKLVGTIIVNGAEKAEKDANKVTTTAQKSAKAIGNSFKAIGTTFEAIGKTVVKVAEVGAAAIGTVSTGIGILTKSAVENYAEYEQLVGGIETLFKNSSDKVMQYANEAYKTAGLSANDYMETVTSFSASLLQSLASDTGEAGELAVDAQKEALDAQYEAVEEANDQKLELMEESHEREIESFEELTEQKIALINEQYKENMKLIDEEKYNQLKAIDAQIDALNNETKAEKAANKKREQEQKKASLQEKINTAKTAEAKIKAEQDLADYISELAQEEREAQRDAQIQALKDQKEAVKEQADAKKAALKEQQDAEIQAVKEASEKQLKELKKAQEKELEALKKSNKEKLAETADYIEKQKALIEANASNAVYTAETYDKAADKANQAIIDMSDNANKMGTDMSMIQNAYQGFAKQNYTMLDNLKLGYGGTKEEMQRLLDDASKLSGIEYDISSFGDIVDAIHVIQTEMGITGTTSKEASTTIQGSISAMKGAWSNFITGMSDESQDFDTLVNNVIDSILTVGSNLVPRIAETLPRLIEGLSQLVQKIVPYIPQMLKTLVPAIVQGAKQLLNDVTDQLPDLLETIFPEFGGELGENIVKFINSFKSIFSKITPMLQNFAKKILPVISKLLDKLLPAFENIVTNLLPPMERILDIILPLLLDIVDAVLPAFEKLLPLIADALVIILEPLAELVESVLPILNQMLGILIPLIEGVLNFLTPIVEVVGNIFTGVVDLIGNALEPLAEAFGFVKEKTDPAVEAAKREAEKLADVKKAADEARDAIDKKTEKDLEAVDGTQKLWKELQTLCDEEGNVMDKDKDRAKFITDELEKALGIEIEWTDNQIQGYKNLQEEIDKTIAKKRMEILMAGAEEKYAEAIKKQSEADANRLKYFQLAQAERRKQEELEARGAKNSDEWVSSSLQEAQYWDAYQSAEQMAQDYYNSITQYEQAHALALEGKTAEAIEMLNKQNDAFITAEEVSQRASEQQLAILETQVKESAEKMAQLQHTLLTLPQGTSEATRKMHEDAYNESKDFFANCIEEYKNAGGAISTEFINSISSGMSVDTFKRISDNVVEGITKGLEEDKVYLTYEVEKMVNDVIAGVTKGASEKYKKYINAAEDMFMRYDESLGEYDDAYDYVSQAYAKSGTPEGKAMLERLDKLIRLQENGFMNIYLDSGELVGGLASGMDSILGDRFALKGRGM